MMGLLGEGGEKEGGGGKRRRRRKEIHWLMLQSIFLNWGEVYMTLHELLSSVSSLVLSTFSMLNTHHLCQVPKHFHSPKMIPARPPGPARPSPGNHLSAFSLYGFTCSGYFIYMESENSFIPNCVQPHVYWPLLCTRHQLSSRDKTVKMDIRPQPSRGMRPLCK